MRDVSRTSIDHNQILDFIQLARDNKKNIGKLTQEQKKLLNEIITKSRLSDSTFEIQGLNEKKLSQIKNVLSGRESKGASLKGLFTKAVSGIKGAEIKDKDILETIDNHNFDKLMEVRKKNIETLKTQIAHQENLEKRNEPFDKKFYQSSSRDKYITYLKNEMEMEQEIIAKIQNKLNKK